MDFEAYSEEFPIKLWGLDPLYWAYVRLFISQIHHLKPFHEMPETQSLFGHPISRVEILGFVVSVQQRASLVSYIVDDGTGLIQCTHWWANSDSEREVLAVGDLAWFRGKFQFFREKREISVHSIQMETDPNAEAAHWLEVIQLNLNVYSKSSRIQLEIAQHQNHYRALHSLNSSVDLPTMLVAACVQRIKAWGCDFFLFKDLVSDPELLSVIQQYYDKHEHHSRIREERDKVSSHVQLLFANVVQQMTRLGYIHQRDPVLDQYQVITIKGILVPLVRSYISARSSEPGIELWGVPFSSIVESVQFEYPYVPSYLIAAAIQVLQDQSEICEAFKSAYILVK